MNAISHTAVATTTCYHCGDTCKTIVAEEGKTFCCEGCHQVYMLLNENNLCNYYNLSGSPGIKAKGRFVKENFAYLDDENIVAKLLQFNSDKKAHVTFELPQMHCVSCIYLLENLHKLMEGVLQTQVNFQKKEIFIVYNPQQTTLRAIVEMLAYTGYEPYISLKDASPKAEKKFDHKRIYKIGVAGFCFANIMMLSFPEYFSAGRIELQSLKMTFSWLIFGLSLPVLFYSAAGFFASAWRGIRQKFLNVDAPIALAILVTYLRSYYEIISGTGSGYLDSGTGIVFFMLAGRWFQDKTTDSLSFDRDYRSYFPLGVTVITSNTEKNIPVTKLEKGNHIIIRNEEMVPADAILLHGDAIVDYSFVSGESNPVPKKRGELIYAGAKQKGGAIKLEVVSTVSQSYITRLWNNDIFSANKKNENRSFIHPWSRYFTIVLFAIALTAVIYWGVTKPTNILPALTSVLIVACPCSLLLATTFTYGNMLRIFGKNKFYLKNSSVIEALAKADTIVFDKTGTITQNSAYAIEYTGTPLTEKEKIAVASAAAQSSHPLSKLITAWFDVKNKQQSKVDKFCEQAGAGIEASVNNLSVKLGSSAYLHQTIPAMISYDTATHVHLAVNNSHMGSFSIASHYRSGIEATMHKLQQHYSLHVLSGDNDAEKISLKKIFGKNVPLLFQQTPQQKLEYVKKLQTSENKQVLMLGDGLNDAGALMQANAGIAVSDNTSRFSPASDAILDGSEVSTINNLLRFAKSGKTIITFIFIVSVLYNLIGLSFAVQAKLSPIIAAILMPLSSISIILLSALLTTLSARHKGL